jgi:hypothetical protein
MALLKNPVPGFIISIFLVFLSHGLFAQTVITEKTKIKKVTSAGVITSNSKEITVDLGLRALSETLPFDEPFVIKLMLPANSRLSNEQVIGVKCYYSKIVLKTAPSAAYMALIRDEDVKDEKVKNEKWIKSEGLRFVPTDSFSFPIAKLPPNRDFTFIFEFERKLSGLEKEKLLEFTQKEVRATLEKFAGNKNFEFNEGEINAIIPSVKAKLASYLAGFKLGTDFEAKGVEINSNEKGVFKNTIINLTNSYEGLRLASEEMEKVKVRLDGELMAMKNFTKSYQKNTKDDDRINNFLTLTKLDDLGRKLLEYPRDKMAQDEGKNQKYQADISKYQEDLGKLNLKDPVYTKMKERITDILQAIHNKHIGYVESLDVARESTTSNVSPLVDVIATNIYENMVVIGSSFNPDFKTRANTHISADLGVAVIPSLAKMTPYLGTNIYFRPVNRNEKLTWAWSNMGKRVSLMLGLTIGSLAKPSYRADLFAGSFNLITGVGLRVASFVRINGGAVWYSKVNPNPLISNNTFTGKPFVSLSFDLDVKTVFNRLFGATDITTIAP